MKWIDLEKEHPNYKEVVLVTNKQHNEEEIDERGEYLAWHDKFDSGIRPTHFCRIPKL